MDLYTYRARLGPMIILFIPLVLVGAAYSYSFSSYIHVITSTGVTTALVGFLAQVGRDRGKKKEPALWHEWGGVPSVQLLRWSNAVIDQHTKDRYHRKLQSLSPVTNPPTELNEAANSSAADNVYKSWCTYLISQTRDTGKFGLLFKENMNYGYRRNLWALKGPAVVVILFMLIALYSYHAASSETWNPLLFPKVFAVAVAILLVLLFCWIFIVNKEWVKSAAFAYAQRLLETTELL